jgi:hypothetical protein
MVPLVGLLIGTSNIVVGVHKLLENLTGKGSFSFATQQKY